MISTYILFERDHRSRRKRLQRIKKKRRKHDHWYRKNIEPGTHVSIVLKSDQSTGNRTEGHVDRILTSKPRHTQGIKVMLTTGQVGRVQEILDNPKEDI